MDGVPAPDSATEASVDALASLNDVSSLLLDIDLPPVARPLGEAPLFDASWHQGLDDASWHQGLDDASWHQGLDDASWHQGLDDSLWPSSPSVIDGVDSSAESADSDPQLLLNENGGVRMSSNATRTGDGDATPALPGQGSHSRERTLACERRRQYRAKKKTEMHQLREAAATLASKVAEIQERQSAAASPVSNRLAAGWRGVALRQKQRRIQAEVLNRELRALVRRHHSQALEVIDKLHVIGLASEPAAALVRPSQQRKPVMVLDECDRHLIETFRRELGDIYARVDSVLDNCEMPEVGPGNEHGMRCVRRWNHDAGCECVELTEAHAVPFAFQDAVYALRKVMPTLCGKECVPATLPLPESEFAVATKFQFSGGRGGAAALRYNCLAVGNEVMESDRCVYVWRSILTECNSPGSSFSEEVWGTARTMRDDSSGQSVGTMFKFYTRARSHQPSSVSGSAPLVKYLEQVVQSMPNEAVEFTQAIENVLVDEMAALSVSTGNKLSTT